jgi:hypothetical protein
MSEVQQPEKARLGWTEVFRRAWSLVKDGKLAEAISHIDAFLSLEVDPESRSQALGFRAHIEERLGNAEKAKNDLLAARSLTGPNYDRYVHELCLGSLFESQNLNEEARSWYRTALNTSLLDNGTSGGTVLKRLLQLCPVANLPPDDIVLCRRVIEHSWRVLRLTGMPDLSDLEAAASIILHAEGRPVQGSG